ncbi:polysaccharide biosynthesis/export family protein [Salegentibacter sp. F188]|uniref:Polysaccharide biosynthesis/export family protein n=1 Tax=Autumnicola patrickiae TaxID=3075591 RepID=A0ABU3DY12_9FLAO|nr:polysaccharide biosynthesis/export family protein [Salegentibacter sp. F188]MDT0688616.1 polysaccharide biosynthesis/export family protein [Salegentibacter sp. F188]
MKIKGLLFLLAMILSFSSCISTKKLSYLQENPDAVDSVIDVQRLKKPYRIQIGDLLSIRVKALDQELVGMFNPIDEASLNATTEERVYFDGFTVDDHGNIRVPTLGELNVLGYTVDEVREMVEKELLERYFRDEANLFVTVKLAGIRYTTLGEIGSGSQVIYKEQVTIIEAIANAGGITDVGDRAKVKIVRQYPQGEEIHMIDVTSIEATSSPYYYIQPNDVIIVNPLPQKALGFGTTGLESFRTIATFFTLITSVVLIFTR